MSNLFDLRSTARRGATVLLPLLPTDREALPPFRIERLGEDRFRLTMAARGLAPNDIDVYVEGGLLHIGYAGNGAAGAAFDGSFLLLEPLTLTRVALDDDELLVELERDHATPCIAVPPPPRRESTEALALAA